MEAACDRWARMKVYAIFYEWESQVLLEKKRHLLGKYFFFMTGIKQKDVYTAWKNWYRSEKKERESKKYRNAKEEADRLKAELERVRKHNADMSKQIATLRKEIAALEKKLEEALNILLQEARQPPGLELVLKGLSKALGKFQGVLARQLDEQIRESFRDGSDTLRLAPLYTWRSAQKVPPPLADKERTKEGELDPMSDGDEKGEEEVKRWFPGQYTAKSEENTPAFYPFKTRPGGRSRRWANNLIRRDWMREDVPRGQLWTSHEKMADCDNWHSIFRSLKELAPQIPQIPPLVVPERTCDDYFKENPNVPRAMHFVEYLRTTGGNIQIKIPSKEKEPMIRDVLNSLGRYVDQKTITCLEPPETPEAIKIREERMRKLASRQADTGIVVHVVSKYMGMRVHVMDTGEQKSAALMAEAFTKCFKTVEVSESRVGSEASCERSEPAALLILNSTQIQIFIFIFVWPPSSLGITQLWPGYMDKCFEKYNKLWVEGWEKNTTKIEEVLSFADASDWFKIGEKRKVPMWVKEYASHDTLKKHGKNIAETDKNARIVANSIIADYNECLADRKRYRQHIKDLKRHTYQSLCTTMLSRRLRTEEDIDDGTFTTVERVQFAGEYKRCGVLNEEVQEEQCLEMKKYLKVSRERAKLLRLLPASRAQPSTTQAI